MAHMTTSLRKCLEQLQPDSAEGRWGKTAAKLRAESRRPLWHGRRERTKTLKHSVPTRGVAQAAARASTGLTRTHGPFRMRKLPSHKDERHSWMITHTKKSPVTTSLRNSLGPLLRFASRAAFPVLCALQLQRG